MFVVDEIPAKQQRCFDRKSPPECLGMDPQLEPLDSTDVTFGISVYEYWAPSVTEVMGYDLAARASIAGTDYLVSQVLTPGDGQHGFTATLPETTGERLVGVLDGHPAALSDCQLAAGSDLDAYHACEATWELRIGDRIVTIDDNDFVQSMAGAGFSPGLFLVPDGDQEIELRVGSGDPDHIDFALVVLEEVA